MKYIIAYDIASPKRLKRIHKTLQGYAIPVQYSIFYAELNSHMLQEMRSDVIQVIDSSEDDVRIYPINDFDVSEWNKASMHQVNSALLVI
ncbi:CRISPR-associated endonuclease Cas2 [Vibrio breoganii]